MILSGRELKNLGPWNLMAKRLKLDRRGKIWKAFDFLVLYECIWLLVKSNPLNISGSKPNLNKYINFPNWKRKISLKRNIFNYQRCCVSIKWLIWDNRNKSFLENNSTVFIGWISWCPYRNTIHKICIADHADHEPWTHGLVDPNVPCRWTTKMGWGKTAAKEARGRTTQTYF